MKSLKVAAKRITIAQIRNMDEVLREKMSTYCSEDTEEREKWKVKVKALVNSFGAVEVVVLFEGKRRDGKYFKLTQDIHQVWVEEAYERARSTTLRAEPEEPGDVLDRVVLKGNIMLCTKEVWNRDIVYKKLWEESDAVRLPVLSHRTLGTFFRTLTPEEKQTRYANLPTILTFYSYKGGMGRTTALAFVAKQLADRGKKVFVIDCDLEAPGVHTLLTDSQPDKGLLDYLLYSRYEHDLTPRVGEYVLRADRELDPHEKLWIMPAGNVDDPTYLEKLSHVDIEKLEVEEHPGVFQKLFEKIKDEYRPDYILIDSRTGLTSVGGAMLFTYPRRVFAMIGYSEQQKSGLRQLANHIRKSQAEVDFKWVFTMKPEGEMGDSHMRALRGQILELVYTHDSTRESASRLAKDMDSLAIPRKSELTHVEMRQLSDQMLQEFYKPIVQEIVDGEGDRN